MTKEPNDFVCYAALWLYSGVCLCLWNNSWTCWVLVEGFVVAVGIFVGVPCLYLWRMWKWFRQ